MNKIISCSIHDHFEVACMRRSNINIILHDTTEQSGIAMDLESKDKREYLHLKTSDEKKILKVDLLDIKTLQFIGDDTLIPVSS